jgi:hypothetical protein
LRNEHQESRFEIDNEIGIVTILLDNTVMNTGDDVDKSIEILNKNPEATSCMTVWKAQDDPLLIKCHNIWQLSYEVEGYII